MTNIIPRPTKVTEREGFKKLSASSRIYISKELSDCAEVLLSVFPFSLGGIAENESVADIRLLFDPSLSKEAYYIDITEKAVSIYCSRRAGALYAAASLKQILFFEKGEGGELSLQCIEIFDEPRFAHRGVQLDEARHFFGEEAVKRLLRLMAFYKLNVLHWHLTDDQGWRIEIKKYPLLTEIGSKRKDSSVHGWHRADLEGKPHSGYYTQQQIRDIVSYAKKLNIKIIPEIDMPAHFAAAMAAYNELGCREIPCEVHWFFGSGVPNKLKWHDWNRSACVGKESTYTFIFDVIDEVAELFPAEYFHIGGDEAPKDEWKNCPHCQKRMKENGLSNVEELQGYFNNRVAKHLKEKGKTLIVWNEALAAGNLDLSVVGQYWTPQNDKNVSRELEKGRRMIISKHQAFYFDMCYCQYPLSNTYLFEPTEKIVPKERESQIVGLEGHLWTEWIASLEKLDMQMFPRALALSEICWVKKDERNASDFLSRLPYHKRILESFGVNYAEDKISMPKGFLHKKHEVRKWYYDDQDRELRRNRKLKKR